MSQRLLDRQTLNSLISELTEISELAIAEGENAVADVARLRQQTEQLAAMSSAAVENAPTAATPEEPVEASTNEPGAELEPEHGEEAVASQAAQNQPLWLNFDEASQTLLLEWPYTQDPASMSQRVHHAIERWLDEAELKGALSQLQVDYVQLANSGEAPQQWRCTLVKNKGRQRHLQILCEYKKQRQLAAQAVVHTQ